MNSLTHMVVVVDENSGDGATAALEEKLQVNVVIDLPKQNSVRPRSYRMQFFSFFLKTRGALHCLFLGDFLKKRAVCCIFYVAFMV